MIHRRDKQLNDNGWGRFQSHCDVVNSVTNKIYVGNCGRYSNCGGGLVRQCHCDRRTNVTTNITAGINPYSAASLMTNKIYVANRGRQQLNRD